MAVWTALLGVFLIAYPMFTATITTLLFVCILIIVGVAQFLFALYSQSIGSLLLKILFSGLFVIAGIGIAFFPVTGVAALTVLLGAMFVIGAGFETVTAFRLRPMIGWGWFLFNAAASLFVGILILAGWPASSVWAIGTLVGVSVLLNGISRVMIAGLIRSSVSVVEREFP